MLQARLTNASILKKIFDSLKELIIEGMWIATSTGLSLEALDSTHVSLVFVQLFSSAFDKFECDKDVSMGIRIPSMSKLLKCANNDDIVTIRATDMPTVVLLTFESPTGERTSQYELKLIDLNIEHLTIPDIQYSCEINMPSLELQKICKHLGQIGEYLKIACSTGCVEFSAHGDLGSGCIKLRQNNNSSEDQTVQINVTDSVTLAFSLHYLNFMVKATPLSRNVSLSLSPELPLNIEYNIPNTGFLRYYLAPNINDD